MREIVGRSAKSEIFLPTRWRISPAEGEGPAAAFFFFGTVGTVSSPRGAGQSASFSSASSPAGAQSVSERVQTSVVRRSRPSAIIFRSSSFSTGPRRSSPTA